MTMPKIYWPPEWGRHDAIWVGWPRLEEEWGAAFAPARLEIAEVVRHLSASVPVRLAVGDDHSERAARQHIGPSIDIRRVPTGDIWLRDTGPVFVQANALLSASVFEFNGWGGKFQMEGDEFTAKALADEERAQVRLSTLVTEGGAMEGDGTGRLLTTRTCLLNENRNPGISQTEVEQRLADALGILEILWLDDGLHHDHTDGHIDNIARFVGPGRVVCQRVSDPADPQRDRLEAAEHALRTAGLEVVTVPAPVPVQNGSGDLLPASHMNFVLTNGLCLMPEFDARSAEAAKRALAEALPQHEIESLPSGNILAGGGSFHCMTCHVPAIPLETPA